MQPKVLVIGSRNHNRADCIDWLQPFPNIEEYDSVIISLQSLTQEIYDKIQTMIYSMKEPINTVFNTNREIFCIMSKLMLPSLAPILQTTTPGYISPTNYDWLPVRIGVDSQKTGSSIIIRDRRFEKYFESVDRWNFEISISPATLSDLIAAFAHSIYPIAINKSQKAIAGSLKRATLDGKLLKGNERGAIHLLPPPTKSSIVQSIELVLDLIFGEETKPVPPWRKSIEVPKENELETYIGNKIRDIKKIQEEISELRNQVQDWDSYRDLFTTTGDDLENIVQKALADIGIKASKTERGFPADLLSKEFAIEVTGIKGCIGVGSEKVNQTARFKESYNKEEKIVVVANTYMDLSPEDRKGKFDFSPEVTKFFKSLSVCCLTTLTLFQLWKAVMLGKRDSKNVIKKILTTNGELTLDKF